MLGTFDMGGKLLTDIESMVVDNLVCIKVKGDECLI